MARRARSSLRVVHNSVHDLVSSLAAPVVYGARALPPHAASDAARPSVTASIAAAGARRASIAMLQSVAGMAPKLSHSATMCRMRLAPDDDFELELELDELPSPGDEPAVLSARLAAQLGGSPPELPPLEIRKRSLDARRGRIRFHFVVGAAGDAALGGAPVREVAGAPVVIVGGGPAGLFCAYELARAGVPAVILDRGKLVQARRRDLK